MRFLHRLVSGILVVAVTAVSAAATPVQAAGGTITVDNTGRCRNAVPTFAAAVALAGAGPARIVVCPGTYAETISISGAHDITLLAKKGATLVPPDSAFAGNLITFFDSTNITVQGFTINGNHSLQPGAIAVFFGRTSGKISGNTFNNWYSEGSTRTVMAMGPTPGPLHITANNFVNYGGTGIALYGPMSPMVTGNELDTTQADTIGINGYGLDGGRISGNRLSSTSFPVYTVTYGIILDSSNNLRVSGNRLTHFDLGIVLFVGCGSVYSFTSDFNRITGNRINETGLPISVAVGKGDGACSVQANNNTITGNKLVNTADGGVYGIQLFTIAHDGEARADMNVVRGNTIKHFEGPTPNIIAGGAGASLPTGVFGPNRIIP